VGSGAFGRRFLFGASFGEGWRQIKLPSIAVEQRQKLVDFKVLGDAD
jgi:hypothetical protein